jgi:hypothetical protein
VKQTSIPLHNKPTACHEPDLLVDEEGLQNALEHWIKLAYRHTEAHQAGFRLYELHLAGDLSLNNEPFPLISAVVERGEAERIKRTPKKNIAIRGKKKTDSRSEKGR